MCLKEFFLIRHSAFCVYLLYWYLLNFRKVIFFVMGFCAFSTPDKQFFSLFPFLFPRNEQSLTHRSGLEVFRNTQEWNLRSLTDRLACGDIQVCARREWMANVPVFGQANFTNKRSSNIGSESGFIGNFTGKISLQFPVWTIYVYNRHARDVSERGPVDYLKCGSARVLKTLIERTKKQKNFELPHR